jgi:hypothetical protein
LASSRRGNFSITCGGYINGLGGFVRIRGKSSP